jgi:alpha/beta superfamily hydrolase
MINERYKTTKQIIHYKKEPIQIEVQEVDPQAPTVLLLPPEINCNSKQNRVIEIIRRQLTRRGFNTIKTNFAFYSKWLKTDESRPPVNGDYEGAGWVRNLTPSDVEHLEQVQYFSRQMRRIFNQSHTFYIVGFGYGALVGSFLVEHNPEFQNFLLVNPHMEDYRYDIVNTMPIDGTVLYSHQDYRSNLPKLKDYIRRVKSRHTNIKLDLVYGGATSRMMNQEDVTTEALNELVDDWVNGFDKKANMVSSDDYYERTERELDEDILYQ